MEFKIEIKEELGEYGQTIDSQLQTSTDLGDMKHEGEGNSAVELKTEIKEEVEVIEDKLQYVELQLSAPLELEDMGNEIDDKSAVELKTEIKEEVEVIEDKLQYVKLQLSAPLELGDLENKTDEDKTGVNYDLYMSASDMFVQRKSMGGGLKLLYF
uniref:Uncharacterized protein LOC114347632 n=1 Tax=Diabrotica virgifera virgifera TaxID=50390 RepID=A0A6P7H6C2_DIAVI